MSLSLIKENVTNVNPFCVCASAYVYLRKTVYMYFYRLEDSVIVNNFCLLFCIRDKIAN